MCRDRSALPVAGHGGGAFRTVAVLIVVVLLVAILAAFLRDRSDSGSARRAALRDALDRGEIRPEDYARALQSPV